MRTSLKLLAVATLLLPGCILVTRDGWNEAGDSRGKSSFEQRVAALEAQVRHYQEECEMSACKCMDKEHEEGEEGEEGKEHAGAH